MNKARITYRFDPSRARENGTGDNAANGEAGRVISLFQEEYRVVDEQTDQEISVEHNGRGQKGGSPAAAGPNRAQEREDVQTFREPSRQRQNWDREIRDYQGLNQYTTDFGAWSSPFDAETQRIEDLIRDSNEREGRGTADAPGDRRPDDAAYDRRFGGYRPQEQRWQDEEAGTRKLNFRSQPDYSRKHSPQEYERDHRNERDYRNEQDYGNERNYRDEQNYGNERDYRNEPDYQNERDGRNYPVGRDSGQWEGPVVTGPRYVRHNRTPWLKISAAIAGAAVTGVLLGVFALSLFNGPDPVEPADEVNVVADVGAGQNALPVSAGVQGADSGKTASGAAVSSGKEVSLVYAGKSYMVLQHGIFSVQQGADQAKSDLVKQGLAAASEQADKFYVFAGVTMDKESAAVLSKQLKEQKKLDIYAKAYTLPSVTKVRWNGNPDTLKSYLEQSDKLIQSLSLLTVMNLETGTAPSPIDASTLQSITSAHAAWSQLSTAVVQDAGDDNKALLQKMNGSMNSAKTSLDEYKKNPSQAMLWQAQTYTLQFIIDEKELLARIGA
ncbi:MAG: hypothetical protein K0R57_5261 [Paenibacillaceae bacterium]|nr:hypothetical protein [Paenibacillaceae bacterium]